MDNEAVQLIVGVVALGAIVFGAGARFTRNEERHAALAKETRERLAEHDVRMGKLEERTRPTRRKGKHDDTDEDGTE